MPQYFFDLHNGIDTPDCEGRVLLDDAAAYAHGVMEAVEMVSAASKEHGKIDLAHWIQVRCDDGRILAKIKFDEAVRFERSGKPV